MTRAILATLILLAAGCADLKAVREYGAMGKGIATSFSPFVEESSARCREVFEYSDIATRRYDPQKSSDEGKAVCRKNAEASKAMIEVSSLIADYHDALVKTAGGDVATSLGGDYRKLGAAVKDLKLDGTPLFPAARLDALQSVVNLVTKYALAYGQQMEIREALSVHKQVADLADVLVVYVERNYGGYLTQAQKQTDEALKVLADIRVADPYGINLLRRELFLRSEMLKGRQAAIAAYRTSTEKMKTALSTLAETNGQPSTREQWQTIFDLSQEVRDLYKKVAAAY